MFVRCREIDAYDKDISFSDVQTKKIKRKASISKNDHFRNLISVCAKNKILFDYILADNWFGSAENMEYIDHYIKKQFIIGIKSNRTVALSKADKTSNQFQQVSSLDMEDGESKQVWLKDVKFIVTLIKKFSQTKTDRLAFSI